MKKKKHHSSKKVLGRLEAESERNQRNDCGAATSYCSIEASYWCASDWDAEKTNTNDEISQNIGLDTFLEQAHSKSEKTTRQSERKKVSETMSSFDEDDENSYAAATLVSASSSSRFQSLSIKLPSEMEDNSGGSARQPSKSSKTASTSSSPPSRASSTKKRSGVLVHNHVDKHWPGSQKNNRPRSAKWKYFPSVHFMSKATSPKPGPKSKTNSSQ